MAINVRFVLRALAISLLFHAWLLLQTPPRVSLPASTPLEAELRPIARAGKEMPLLKPPPNKRPSTRETSAARDAVRGVPVRDAVAPSPAANESLSIGFGFAEARKSYVFTLVHEARRIKQNVLSGLPREARGTSEVRIAVDVNGLPQALLQTSSGSARIDEAALALIGAALARTPIPEDLRGEAFDLIVPLSFGD